MNIKQLSAIALSTVFSLGAVTAVAYEDAQSEDRDSSFEMLDQNRDGVIDRDEARQSGITDEQFDEMDSAGDGVISQEEYREHDSGLQQETEGQDNDW